MTKGFNDFNTNSNDFNTWQFMIKSALSKIRTAFLAKVVNVYKEKNLVDIFPIIKGVDGNGNELEQLPIFRIPYFQYVGGSNKIIITPEVNDYGLCITSDRDITNFKINRKETKPATLRMFDARDSLYLGGFLNKKQIKNLIEINNNGIKVKTDGTMTIEATGEIDIISDSSLNITVQKDGKQSSLMMNENQIKLETNGQTVVLDENGLTINVKNLSINVLENMNLNVKGKTQEEYTGHCNIIANSSYNISSNKVNFIGLNNLALMLKMQGVTQIEGQLLTQAVVAAPPVLRLEQQKEQSESNNTNAESTKGVLTTAPLDDWDIIKNYFPDEGIHFKIKIAEQNFEITVPQDILENINNYTELSQEIQKQIEEVADIEVTKDLTGKEQLTITTKGTGDIEGYISYMEDIVDNKNATSGILKTGSFTTYHEFLNTLNSQNLAFRITVSGLVNKYQLIYSEFSTKANFTEFANYLSSLNENLIVSVETTVEEQTETNKLVFETKNKGSAKGRISYMKETDTPDTSAIFLSGELTNYNDFLTQMNNQNFAVKTKINGKEQLFYCSYEDLTNYTDFSTFVKAVFNNSLISTSFTIVNKINLTTKLSGSSATFEFFNSVNEIKGSSSTLKTGALNSFETIKELYGTGTVNITFYITADTIRTDYVITPDNLNSFYSWGEMAQYLTDNSDNLTISYDDTENVLIFSVNSIGRKDISYLSYEEPQEGEEETINGAVLLSGTENISTITLGTDNISNINQNCINLLKLTEETGAVITNGQTLTFADNSIILLKGTEDTGATITQGKDGVIVMLNASATWLKGTIEEGALRFSGTDDGIPDVYDGIAKITGSLLVSDKTETENLEVNKDTNLTGSIVLNPYDITEEGEVYKKSEVIVNGGIIAENATITETANINTLVVSESVEINGDITLNNSRIIGNGNVLSFDNDGVRNNKMFISTDYKAE